MRWVGVLVLLAACTDSPPTDLDRMNALLSGAVSCGFYDEVPANPQPGCQTADVAQSAADCMNNALATRTKARYGIASKDSDGFDAETVYIAVDGTIETFYWHPGQSNDSNDPIAEQQGDCTGPFVVGEATCPYGGGSATFTGPSGCEGE